MPATKIKMPLPPAGPMEHVPVGAPTAFNWEYEVDRAALINLYEKSKRLQWNASTDIDWSIDVDPEAAPPGFTAEIFNNLTRPPKKLDEKKLAEFRLHRNAWMLSQFMHGEQGALVATSLLVNSVPWLEAKFYAAQQVADEARHVEVYHRYLTTKLGLAYPVNRHLQTLLGQIVRDRRWDMIYLGMQIMVEGLALAAFGFMNMTDPHEKLINQITGYVIRDEARHVGFGVLSLAEVYKDMTEGERREREEFVIEASVLMRDRLLMEEVWEPMGLDRKTWVEWSLQTPFLVGFRQILFSKIVPNLKRLGLLTPRVREHMRKIGVLDFEFLPDSTEDEGITPPPALMEFFGQLMAQGVQMEMPASPA
ncbi:MAG TPA: ferritin-like domain-containing protein [Candidatus Bathyarchaeia archaeon]|nr:ferritin-like domain-containing protein [Candidatus Bathyarchaeia archaeon]